MAKNQQEVIKNSQEEFLSKVWAGTGVGMLQVEGVATIPH